MYCPLEQLSDSLLDGTAFCSCTQRKLMRWHTEVTSFALGSRSVGFTLLGTLGSRVHASAARVLFRTVSVVDDCKQLDVSRPGSQFCAILTSPERYADNVKVVIIKDPPISAIGNTQPLDACQLDSMLKVCTKVGEIKWESSYLPPDGLFEARMFDFLSVASNITLQLLATHNPCLTRFSFMPTIQSHQRLHSSRKIIKWNAPSIPLLSTLVLTHLQLSSLSQSGAQAFIAFLISVADFSTLESLTLDFVWLNDALCESITKASRKLRSLSLTTRGTKLTDAGVCCVLEGCGSLEELILDRVQGEIYVKISFVPLTVRRVKAV